MASNSFGTQFRFTTWGESHGTAIGVIIDGCPAGIEISIDMINSELKKRSPGQHHLTSPRKEADQAELLSGIHNGITTGAPISIMLKNSDVKSSSYQKMYNVYRPGHANYTYLNKYGLMDQHGGGRASARETAARVAAGAVAGAILARYNIEVTAYMHSIGNVSCPSLTVEKIYNSTPPLYLADKDIEQAMFAEVQQAKNQGDSIGGVVACTVKNPPCGLGEPIYDKLEAKLAYAMLSIPASKGFEIGMGFAASKLTGSQHNDCMHAIAGQSKFSTNNAGGILGGISNGEPINFKVAFKPTSSIKKTQATTNHNNEDVNITLAEGSRHDPCVAIRAIPVVAAMTKCVIADCILLNQLANINTLQKPCIST